jgi:energy-coupling factor transport system ATP-binding protein
MIRFESLSYSYPQASQPVLRDVSFELPEGSITLILGASGSGKSTLLRCIGGLVPFFSGGVVAGALTVAGRQPLVLGPNGMSQSVGYVFQDPETQAVMESIEDEISFGMEQAGVARSDMRIRVEEVLDLLDLAPLRDRRLETLSGGERQRVAIAAVLALRPQILVLDEPTSQLDPQSAEDVLRALTRLNEDLGLTIVIAEQRLERVLPFVDTLIYLDPAQPGVQIGSPDALLGQLPYGPPIVVLGKALGWQPLPLTIRAGLRYSKQLDYPLLQKESPPPAATNDAITVRGLRVSYAGVPALRGVDIQVGQGEAVVLLGRSGSGKSSLLRALVGLVAAEQGQILLNGQPIIGRETADICREVAFLPQDPNALLFAETVREELQTTLRNHQRSQPQSRRPSQQNVPGFGAWMRSLLQQQPQLPHSPGVAWPVSAIDPDQLLRQLGIADLADRYPRDLSVGERQRVALAAVLVTGAGILLLDEPTRGLDQHAKQQLAALLARWRDQGMAILLITHDVEFAALIATRVVLLARGEVIASGTPAEILGASPLFAPQAARLFPGAGWLTAADVLRGLGAQ